MNHRKPLASLTARSAAIMGILTVLALAGALFALYVHPAHAQEGSAPAKPTGLFATATHDQVVLTWNNPQDDSITGYMILRRVRVNNEGGKFSELVADTGTAATTYTDNTVAAETTYTYRIKAINEHGVSERSRWYHIDIPAEPEPASNNPATGSPTITGTAQVGETLTVDTSSIADEDGLENAAFSYQWLADGTAISGATANAYTPVGADEGKAITVQVNFTDDAGKDETLTSAPTAAVAGAEPTEPPAQPTGLIATATHDSLTLTWNDPQDDSITGYVILRRNRDTDAEGHFDELVADTGTAATTYTDDTVAAGTSYTYRIKAVNGAGTSERSRWFHIDIPAPPEPETGPADLAPSGLTAVLTDEQVALSWDAPVEDAGSVTGYEVLRARGEDDLTTLAADTGNTATTYVDETADAPGESYAYRVKALWGQEKSQASNEAAIQLPDPPSSAPGGLTAQYGVGRVVLAWNAPAEDAASVTGYEILRAEGDAERTTLAADTGNTATTYVDDAATQASAVYAYRVRAIRDEERSQDSNEARVQLPPAAPQGVLRAAAHDSVTLIWNDPQDGTITGYRILRREPAADDPGQFVVLIEDTGSVTTTYTDADVAPSTSYTYRVQAINPHGAGEPSHDVPVETPAVPESLRTLPAETTQQDGTSDEATVSEPEDRDFPTSPITEGYIAIGDSATGSIGRSGDRDAFRVKLESGVTYQIDMKGDATADGTLTNPYLPGLKDADWENIPGTSNDNSNDMLNSQVLFTPTESGSYYIVVRSATEDRGPDSTGTYTVSIKLEGAAEEEQTDLLAADSSTILLLGVGDEVTQTIDHFADEDWIKVILTAGTSYAFTVTGGWADDSLTLEIPWLFGLFDSDSQPLLMYTDGRLGLAWTQVEGVDGVAVGYHKAENDGTYYVSVSSHSDVGTYRVSVQEIPESAYHAYDKPPHGTGVHYHALTKPVWVRNFFAWCPKDMEQGTMGSIPVEGGTHMTAGFDATPGGDGKITIVRYGIMPDGHNVPLSTLARCVGVGDPSSNDNRRWYRLFDHSSASNDAPDLGALSDANPEITRHDYLRVLGEQDWTRFSVSQVGTFCVSVNKPAVSVKWNNGGDGQSIPGTARVYRERVSKRGMSLDFANDPEGAKAAWLANSEIVRVELPSDSSPRAFYSDGTDLPLEDTWYLYDGTIDGDDYSGFVGDKRNVVSYGRIHAKPMADRKFQSQRYVQIDGAEPRDYFARVVHGGTGFSGTDGYILTISLGKCLAHSAVENGNSRSVPPPPKNLQAIQEKGAVQLAWEAPDDAELTGYRIERRLGGGDHNGQQRSVAPHRDAHTLVEDTGSTETGYTDETAETGVEYEYRVSSRNEDGPGEASEWVGATPGDDAASEATDRPHGLTASAENGRVTLTWNAPDHANANAVFNYRILRHRPEKGEPEPLVYVDYTGSRATAYTDTAVEPGVLYVYQVQAADLFGFLGEASEPTSVRMPESTANLPATGAPVIRGKAQVGETLTVDTTGIADEDGLGNVSFAYQWIADDDDIQDATANTYALADDDHGKAIKVMVSFTDAAGNDETLTSAATAAVAARPNSPATGTPAISGTVRVGETLTMDTSAIDDADGLENVSFNYQWQADDADINGATGATYTLVAAEEGRAIKVAVSFLDDAGNDEALTSEATDAVVAAAQPNSPATGAPTITGTAQVGQTLTADTSGIADADGLANATFGYQWLADDTEISGAIGSTYTLTDSEESKAITVQVSFTDDADNEETLTSAKTAAVAGAQPTEPPAKPRGLSATASHDSVTLKWDDPGDDTITGYVILRRLRYDDPSGEFHELAADTGSTATTYTDDTVEADTDYTYRIKAINEHGVSERSRWFHIDTPEAPVPAKPRGLTATASHDSVTLTWDDPGDDSITGYVILRRVRENDQGGEFSELVADTGTAATTYTDDTVAAGITYTYRIKAINEYWVSERSRWFHIDTPAAP